MVLYEFNWNSDVVIYAKDNLVENNLYINESFSFDGYWCKQWGLILLSMKENTESPKVFSQVSLSWDLKIDLK